MARLRPVCQGVLEATMARSRDPVAEIVAACKPVRDEEHRVVHETDPGRELTAEALRRRIEALAAGPFPFLRGTFHLMATDLLQRRVAGAPCSAPEGLVVGDLHLENFGVYRGASGGLCFDVNDFDEVACGPLDLDVRRLCTSAMLLPRLDRGARMAAARLIAGTWAECMGRLGGRFPIAAWGVDKADGWLEELLREKGRRTQAELVAKAAPGKGHRRFGEDGDPPKFAHAAKPWADRVAAGLAEYAEELKQLKAQPLGKDWELLDVAYRFKGTGSLGRLRFAALLGSGDQRTILEFKEAQRSAIDVARAHQGPLTQRARVQAAALRRMQGDPWPRAAGAHLGKVPVLVRELEPAEEKLSCSRFADASSEQLSAYSRQCGEVLARLHCRVNAPALLDADWDPRAAAEAAVAFAKDHAAVVEADWTAFVKVKGEVARELGL